MRRAPRGALLMLRRRALDSTNVCSLAWRTHVRSDTPDRRDRRARLERRRALFPGARREAGGHGSGLRHALVNRRAPLRRRRARRDLAYRASQPPPQRRRLGGRDARAPVVDSCRSIARQVAGFATIPVAWTSTSSL